MRTLEIIEDQKKRWGFILNSKKELDCLFYILQCGEDVPLKKYLKKCFNELETDGIILFKTALYNRLCEDK